MNFDFSDDQQAIKRTANEFLASRYGAEKRRELAESGSYDDGLWKEMSELGWSGIFVEEGFGGQGLGTVELVILMEELGYALAPCPFFSNAAAGLVLAHAGSDEQRERWLPGIASGEALGTVGVSTDEGAALVPDADSAAVIVLLDGDSATLVEAGDADVEPREAIDSTRRLSSVRAGAGEPLPEEVGPGRDRIATALAAELTGVAQHAMDMAVEYARERKQFGRPIGAYQAVSHACAQMLLEVEGARSASYYAAWTADAEPESLPLAASMAKSYASDAGWRVTKSALQVHGGIGFTWEHDLHFFLKRAKADAHLFGTAREHRERVAKLAGLERAATKRPIEREQLEALVDRIVAELRAEGGAPPAERVGELALRGLRELDRVAYVRFASVYRKFADVDEFEAELGRLESEPPLQREHLFDLRSGAA
jgi:alkylation response protein AidB-like acyl-CoA dehydrogenase